MKHILMKILSVSFFGLISLVASSGVGFGAQQPVAGQLHDLPGRIIALAYLVHQDTSGDFEENFLNKPGDEYLKSPFKQIYQMLSHNYDLSGTLAYVSHYCVVQLTPGFFCGDLKLPNVEYGYLFVSDWITGHGKPYILMIVGLLAPGQTSILRITADGKANVLYNSFSKRNECEFKASALEWNVVPTTHYVKVITPTTFEIIAGGFQLKALTSATLKLNVDGDSCKLTVLSKKPKLP